MTKFEEEVKRPEIGICQSSIKPVLGKAVEFYTDKVKEYHNAFSDMNKYIDVIENKLEQKDEQIQSLAKMVDKLNGQNVDLKGELEEVRDLQCEANNQAAKEYIDRCEAETKLKGLQQQALPKTVEDFQGELEDLIDDILDDYISDIPFDGKKYKFIEKYAPQALPVVPEFVAEWIEKLKSKGLKPLKNPETYGETGFTEEKLQNIVFWISEHQEDYMRAWLDGYTVEKQQLFYLKHIDMSESSERYDYYLFKHDGPESLVACSGKDSVPPNKSCKFTQQEIDSMNTGSYEQIEVAE